MIYKGNFKFSDDMVVPGLLNILDSKYSGYKCNLILDHIDVKGEIIIEKKCQTDTIIYGTLENGTNVTLVAFLPNIVSVNGISTFNIELKSLYLNGLLNYNERNKFEFKELVVNFSSLHRWIDFSDPRSTIDTNLGIPLTHFDDLHMELFYDDPYVPEDKPLRGYRSLYLRIFSDDTTSMDMDKLMKFVHKIQDFFNLLYHEEVLINSVYGYKQSRQNRIQIFASYYHPQRMRKPPIGFAFQSLFNSSENNTDAFKLQTLGSILHNYFELAKNTEGRYMFLDFFFDVMYDHGSREENLFLSLCGFFESFYEYKYGAQMDTNKSTRKELFTQIKNLIQSQIPDSDYRKKAIGLLAMFQKPSFQEQIREVFQITADIAPYWSSMIKYFDEVEIRKSIKTFEKRPEMSNNIEFIISKSKEIWITNNIYTKSLKINCLKEALHICSETNLKLQEYIKFLFTEQIPREIITYRNDFAHGNFNTDRKENEIRYAKKIIQLVDILHLIARLCILRELGYSKEKLLCLYLLKNSNLDRYNLILNLNI
ncbi:hypothetical protein [Candidatus Nitrosocosmicus hydrocola]|uniref:ApeA N-terminal domain 1-containing protein n=1 Tax=Candidatus Nitrosocosmicus hydrocola TaxID=1826872 RepID=UPI001E50FBF4|nr:hypothetical protein [Candidatus Nitrosocosmicus hydrocola]